MYSRRKAFLIRREIKSHLLALIYDTPEGATVHVLAEKLDAGEILLQQEFDFDKKRNISDDVYCYRGMDASYIG